MSADAWVTINQPYLPCGHDANAQRFCSTGGLLHELHCECGAGYVCMDQSEDLYTGSDGYRLRRDDDLVCFVCRP